MPHFARPLFVLATVLLLAACRQLPAATATATSPAATTTVVSAATATATPRLDVSSTSLPSTATTAPATPATTPTAASTDELPTLAEPPPGLLLALENSAGGWGLWLVQEDGSLRHLLEEIAAPTYRPDFHISADGRQMLYAYQGDIWRLDLASGETQNVTQTEERLESAPRWLPGDPQRFLAGSFTVSEAGPSPGYLTLIGFDGSYEILDEEGSMTAPPAPSPDGKTIAYSKGQPFLYQLEGPQSGSRPLDLALFELGWAEKAGEASWSPDGSRLAWTLLGAPQETHQAMVVLLDLAAGDHQTLMTYTPAGIGGMPPAPLWSADGDALVAAPMTFEPESRGLWLLDLQGESRRLTEQVARLSHTPNPALSPDGGRLAFSTGAFDAVGVIDTDQWQPHFWRPPDRVAAAGWAATQTLNGLASQAAETRPASGVVTPAAKRADALLPYEPTGGVPAELEAWAWYDVHGTDMALPIPPGWLVHEWPLDGDAQIYTSASVQPPLWADPAECGYQCPEIAVAVWRLPPAASLEAWLAQHGTKAPFGSELSEANDSIFFTGVHGLRDTTVGDLPALAFYDEVMGIRSDNIIFELEGAIVSLTKTHVDTFEFEPVFDFMRRHAQIGPAGVSLEGSTSATFKISIYEERKQ